MDQYANIAMDEADNSILLAEGRSLPGDYVDPHKLSHPRGKSMEWYLDALIEDASANDDETSGQLTVAVLTDDDDPSDDSNDNTEKPKPDVIVDLRKKPQKDNNDSAGEGAGEGDADGAGEGDESNEGKIPVIKHNWMNELDEMSEQELDSAAENLDRQINRIVEKVMNEYENTPTSQRGRMPGTLRKKYDKVMQSKKLPWSALFRQLIHTSMNTQTVRNMGRANRRMLSMGISPFPGKKEDPTYNIAFLVDTSGSMSDDDLTVGLGVIEDIMKSNQDISCTVVEFDTRVLKTYCLSGGRKEPERECWGRGGTSFDEPFKWVRDEGREVDLYIVYTDGYAPNPKEEFISPNKPLVWLMTPYHMKPFDGKRGTYLTIQS